MAGPMFPQPAPMLQPGNLGKHDDFRDSMDVRKQMGMLTPAQLMNVPSAEQIFGLVEKPAGSQKNATQIDNGATNAFGFDTTAITADPGWTKAWSDDAGKNSGASNTTDRASGFFGGFFDNTRNDNRFGNHDGNDSGTLFGQSQPAAQQSTWNSFLPDDANAFHSSAPDNAPNNFAAPGTSSSSDFASQSPFVPQQMSSLGTLPQLPTLQSLPGQSDKFDQPAAAPSWGPKPPPWTTPQSPWGTPVQLKIQR